ncbi:hypothetical protein DENIT_110267 [Pseudomonas veronii]|nr:hypothetical protein DENIT_110267 [Pseudomonas veronii]
MDKQAQVGEIEVHGGSGVDRAVRCSGGAGLACADSVPAMKMPTNRSEPVAHQCVAFSIAERWLIEMQILRTVGRLHDPGHTFTARGPAPDERH